MSDKEFAKGNIVFFFCDMVKSTSIARTLGKERFDAKVLKPYHALLTKVLKANDGRELQYTGDGVFAVFHTPQQAVAAAQQLQEGLRDAPILVMIGEKESVCMARVGLHRSIVDLQPDANGLYPEAYNEIAYAHRVMEPGADEQILVSESLWKAIDGEHQTGKWKEWGNRYLKSYSEKPQSLYELLWDGDSKGEPGARWLPDWYVREINLFIGRVAPMQRIEKWLKEAKRPLLTLHGTGGIGKTRLAVETVIQLGGGFPAGIAFVSLDRDILKQNPLDVTENDLKGAVMTALEVPDDLAKAELYPANESEANSPKSAKPSPFRDWLAQRLKARGKLLLVLDNWESVQNETTLNWLSNLLLSKGLAGLHCLVTSRVDMDLTITGDTFEIAFLQVPSREEEIDMTESGHLFIERARQRADGWEVTPKNRPHLFQILKTLEGHPLGIELVAAGVKAYPGLTEISTGLRDSLLKVQSTPKGQVRSDHKRHASLEASLNWSVERLPIDCRTRFPRVGAFPADFSGEAAMEVADIKEDWLTTWLNASLLTLFSTGPNRYEARPVVREYCRELLGDDLEVFESRFVQFCLRVARLYDNPNLEIFSQFSVEYRNLIGASEILLWKVDTSDEADELNWLGNALCNLPIGDRDANLRSAIASYEAALKVYTEQAFPQDWAMTQNNLGNAFLYLPSGDHDANLRSAIACYEAALRVRTEQAFPQDWATTQNNLGIAYSNHPSGDRDANLRSAITCFEAALRVRTEQTFTQDWAMTQNNLGNALLYLPSGDRNANLSSSISCYESVLRFRTEAAFPLEWATAQNNLGLAYSDLPLGDRSANLRKAIACFEAALRVFTEQAFPQNWAATQNNLGIAYCNLPSGDRDANLRSAIKCYESALKVRTEVTFPQDWATTQNNLGSAYRNLPLGGRDANLRFSIACYEFALKFRTESAFPQGWAGTQANVGLAFSDFGRKREALERLEEAKRVFLSINALIDVKRVEGNIIGVQAREEGKVYAAVVPSSAHSISKGSVFTALLGCAGVLAGGCWLVWLAIGAIFHWHG